MQTEEFDVIPTGEIIKNAMESSGIPQQALVDAGIPRDTVRMLLASRQSLTRYTADVIESVVPELNAEALIKHDKEYEQMLRSKTQDRDPVVFRINIPEEDLFRVITDGFFQEDAKPDVRGIIRQAFQNAVANSYLFKNDCSMVLPGGSWFDEFASLFKFSDSNRVRILSDVFERAVRDDKILQVSLSSSGPTSFIRVYLVLDLGKTELVDQMEKIHRGNADSEMELEQD